MPDKRSGVGRKKPAKTTPRNKGTNQKRRAWFIVLNNPRNYLKLFYRDHPSIHHDPVDTMEQATLALCVARSLCPEDMEEDIGVAVNVEEGNKTGTEHCHIVYYKPDGIRFHAVRHLFYDKARIEEQQGTKTEARDYLEKKGKWENDPKQHTLKVPPIYLGLQLGDNRKTKTGDEADRLNDIIHALVDAGLSPDDVGRTIASMGVKEANKSEAATKMASGLYFEKANGEGRLGADGEKMFVVWHFGSGGVGKTHSLRDLTRDRTSKCHLVDPAIKDHPWDRYNYQPMVVWDDLRDTHMAYDTMLAYMNREGKGQVEGDARYFSRAFAFCRFDITSINSPEKLWVGARKKREEQGQEEPLFQLTRRINLVVYHFEDDRWDAKDKHHWCAVAIRGGRYFKSGEQLTRLAKAYLDDPYNGPQQQAMLAYAVDTAAGATVKPKSKAMFQGASDDVERQIRCLMWREFADDEHREEKLAFLGLTDEEKQGKPKRETTFVVDDSTIGQPQTMTFPEMATTEVTPKTVGQPVPLPVSLSAGQPASQTAGQSAGQVASQFVGQTAGQSAVQTAGQTASQFAGQASGQTGGQVAGQAAIQSASGMPFGLTFEDAVPALSFQDDQVPLEAYDGFAVDDDYGAFTRAELEAYFA